MYPFKIKLIKMTYHLNFYEDLAVMRKYLMLNTLGKKFSRQHLKQISNFFRRIGFDIKCKFSKKNTKNIISLPCNELAREWYKLKKIEDEHDIKSLKDENM